MKINPQNKTSHPVENNNAQLKLLWQAMCKGDESAFERLYALTFDRLYQFGLRMVNERQVEDSLQELYLYAWNQRNLLHHVDNPQAYLYRALRNRLINHIRQNSYAKFTSLNEASEFMYELNPMAEEDGHYLTAKLQKAINQLSPQQREVIFLLYYNEMKADDVAKILDVSLRTVYNTSYNAIQKLREALGDDFRSLDVHSLVILLYYFFI